MQELRGNNELFDNVRHVISLENVHKSRQAVQIALSAWSSISVLIAPTVDIRH